MKLFIKDIFNRMLIETSLGIKPNDAKKLLALGMNSAFDSEGMAKGYLKKNLEMLSNLPDNVTLYRIVFLNDKSELNPNEIGTHYVLKRRELEQSHHQISHVGGGKPYMLTVKAPKNAIDVYNTLANKMQYPHENEISLLNKGMGAKVIRIEEFIAPDEMDFL